ncbi:short-chain dehydrogenase (plasmid) [Deinococcus aetherius]|uniref:Short-chain dehydrogenase n=1 Tax=Deinococcus aetherius TaxID=200252 RepID=A0ABM8AKP1_9DEIO|nr:SDR family NAD(P)-dependent oxidoreductase [Deinococcus aetherius]BDP44390.1 short-chain dehydrogenase [Deinococcus aetherius]
MDVKNKVVLVTGASSGIGKAAAELFAAQGAQVALAARSAEALETLAARLPGSLAIATDMTREKDVRRMVERTHEHYGRIDVLVNNAGRGMRAGVAEVGLQEFRDLLELNVISLLHATQRVVPIMRAQGGGMLVNISSGTTKMLIPGMGLYSATKHVVNHLSDIARLELAPLGIRVSTVYPTRTATDFGFNSVGIRPGEGEAYTQGDSPEYVAGLILEAVRTEAPEVMAEAVRRMAARTYEG